jgi:hypothetical protein
MLQNDERGAAGMPHAVPRDWAPLIRKLRWIGLTEEARRLEDAVRTIAQAERSNVEFGPSSTD